LKCEKCGSDINEMSKSCSTCGFSLAVAGDGIYAGFGKRLIAAIVDLLIILVPSLIIFFAVVFVIQAAFIVSFFGGNMEVIQSLQILGNVIGSLLSSAIFVLQMLYFAGFESSSKQATPGKRVVGIKVTDLQGERISFTKALIRNLGQIASSVMFIGYIIIAFTKQQQGLHDIIAGTLVVNADADL
jgi:uncharacterized RDD family membrane protein YckC